MKHLCRSDHEKRWRILHVTFGESIQDVAAAEGEEDKKDQPYRPEVLFVEKVEESVVGKAPDLVADREKEDRADH